MGISALASTGLKFLKKSGRVYGDLIFGTGQETMTKAVQKQITNRAANGQSYISSVGTGIKNGFKEVNANSIKQSARHGGYFKNIGYQLRTTPRLVKSGWNIGSKAAKAAGKNTFWGGLKGSMGAIGKRLPLLGGILMLASEIPNIWNATKEKGIISGIKETVKSGVRVGTGMAGAAVGMAILSPIPVVGPILGGILGYMAGDKLASLFTGKSYSEKQAEQEELIAQQQQQQQQYYYPQGSSFDTGTTNPFASIPPTMTQDQLFALQQQLYGGTNRYSDDFMYLTMMNQLRKNNNA